MLTTPTFSRTDGTATFTGGSFLSDDGVTSEAGDYLLLRMADDGTYVAGSFHLILDLSDTAIGGRGRAEVVPAAEGRKRVLRQTV